MKLSHSVALLVSVVLSSQLKAGLVEAEQAFARADYQTASAEFLASFEDFVKSKGFIDISYTTIATQLDKLRLLTPSIIGILKQ